MVVPGDPRENYIARMEWAASSDEIVMQHLNRLQNTLEIMLGEAATGQVRTIHTERAYMSKIVVLSKPEAAG